MSDRLACRECHFVQEGAVEREACQNCGSEDWAGYVVVGHPEESQIADEMGITAPGTYALKVR